MRARRADRTKPVVGFEAPAAGSTVSGSLSGTNCEASATDNVGVARVDFSVDGRSVSTDRSAPYDCAWDATGAAAGQHTLSARAVDTSGNAATSSISVSVADSSPAPAPSPTPTPTSSPTPAPSPTPTPTSTAAFDDEFNGTGPVDPSKWKVTNACDNWGSLSCNQAANVTQDGTGNLAITVRKENVTDGFGHTGTWSAGRIEANPFRQVHGTWEASIQVPHGKGFWPSFWTTGDGAWPATGEIDGMEILGDNTFKSYCSVHGTNSSGEVGITHSYTSPTDLAAGFHDYKAVWDSFGVTFYVDGNLCFTGPFQQTWQDWPGQDVKLGIAVGGSWPGSPDATTPTEARMLVDWVRVSS